MGKTIEIYDTTLRDGSQGEGVSFSLLDKLNVTRELDRLGIHYVEGGWPGSNPKDADYFKEVRQLKLKKARVAAFGSTRHAKNKPAEDPNLKSLAAAKTPVITIFGKTWDLHVRDALRVSLDVNLQMISSSIAFLKKKTDQVFYDAEHFFDGYRANPQYAMQTLEAAAEAGADLLVLCDTNGGSMPAWIREATQSVRRRFGSLPIGIHVHNDCGLAVANSLEAVLVGCSHVQGCVNGFGERTGNADLTQVIPNLELKLGHSCLSRENLKRLTEVSRYLYEIANLPLRDHQPFVGRSAFAHKGGIHVSAMARNRKTYEHISPESIGNESRVLISELSGRSNILAVSRIDLKDRPREMKLVLERVMQMENQGYAFENANASFDLLVRKVIGEYRPFFDLKSYRVMSDIAANGRSISEATVKVEVDGKEYHTVAEGDHGPVDSLDKALRKALLPAYPWLKDMRLVDYKVHIVNAQAAAAAKVRVVIESAYHQDAWSTVGVSENIIEASGYALMDSVEYLLLRTRPKKNIRTPTRAEGH